MPLTRYQTRNEYSLADPELYRAADKDDPEALLEGVAMAGLVGVLRQLGDLSEFAAEIFHDLHEEVMATAARGHGLMLRVQQLEAEVPSIEREFLSRTSHSPFLFNAGVGWHANLRMGQNMITRGDLPRCVMDSYEECRGPPRLFLLDKFDVAGTGACLKRYSDPSFFKAEFSSSETMGADVQREKNAHKVKKKGSRWRNGEKPEVHPTSHVKLHQLLSKERNSENNVKLKKRQLNGFPLKSTTGKSYMDRFLEAHSPEREVSYENSLVLPHLNMESSNTSELGLEIREIGTASPDNKLLLGERGLDSSVEKQETALERSMYNLHDDVIKKSVLEKLPEPICDIEIEEVPSSLHKLQDQKVLMVDKESNKEAIVDGYQSDDITSEVDSYMDALATIESEIETDTETRRNNERGFINTKRLGMDFETKEQEKHEAYFLESSSVGNSSESDDETSLFERGRSNPSNMDTLSNLAVKGSPGGDAVAKVATSAGICPVEVVDVSSEKPSVNGNTLVHEPLEYIAPNGSCNEVSVIPSYGSKLVEASPYSCVTDSTATVSRSSPGANLNEFQLQGPDFVGYPSAFMRLSTGAPSLNTEEDTENIGVGVPSSTNLSYSASQMKDDPLSVGFLKSQQMKVMDGLTHLEVSSDALLHQSDISGLVVEGKYDGDNLEVVLPTKCAEDTFTENMSRNHDLPHSVTLPTEGQPSSLEGHDLKVCSSTKQPECLPATISPDDLDDFKSARTLESDIGIQTAGENPEYLISALNIQKTGVSAEQGLSELTEEVLPPQLDIGVGTGSSGVKTLYNNLEVSSNKPAGGVNDEPALDVVQLNSYGSVGNAAAATSSMETDKTLQFAYRNQSNEGAEDPVFTSLSHQELSIPSEQALVLEASPRLSNLLDEQTDSLKGRDQNGCAVVDGANNKQGSQTSEIEETPPPNPFLPLPTTEDEKPEHDSLTFKEEKAQTSLNSFAPPPATEEVRPASDTSLGESGDIQNLSVLKLNIKDGMLQLPVIKDEEPLNSFAPLTIKEEQPLNAFASPTIKDEKPLNAFAPPAMTDEEPSNSSLTLEGEMPSNESNTIPDAEVGMPNGKPPRKPPRPRDPLIEAVASHDRSTLRKVTERVRPQIVQKMDERDAMLDQIRTKSFNLKPTGRPMVTTRSMIQGPRTNLKVAAILEKANAIRQATAGSDEDDDDSWSDC